MTDKLKPCPFCGGKAKIYTHIKATEYKNGVWTEYKPEVWRVMCDARVDCCALLNKFDTKQEAIEAWNRRANE